MVADDLMVVVVAANDGRRVWWWWQNHTFRINSGGVRNFDTMVQRFKIVNTKSFLIFKVVNKKKISII